MHFWKISAFDHACYMSLMPPTSATRDNLDLAQNASECHKPFPSSLMLQSNNLECLCMTELAD
jgi:hypothetical protein